MWKISNGKGSPGAFLLGLAMVVVSCVQDSASELARWMHVTAVEDMGERVRWVAANGTVNEKRTVLGYLGSIHQGERPDLAAADLVARFLDDESPEVLGEAAYYVGYLGGRRHIERVAGLMGHEHEDIRNLAASSVAMLARPGDGSFLPPARLAGAREEGRRSAGPVLPRRRGAGSDPQPSEIARVIREAIARLETSLNAPNG